jgi:lipoprotein NlpD
VNWCHVRVFGFAALRTMGLVMLAILQAACPLHRENQLSASGMPAVQQRRPASGRYHVVASGETLSALAKAYNVDPRRLAEVNDLEAPYHIETGSRVFVPAATEANRAVDATKPPHDRQQVAGAEGTLSWPVEGEIVSRFGLKEGTRYNGIGIQATEGTPVHAAAEGKVGHVGSIASLGNLVLIEHSDRLVTVYAHLKDIEVKEGQSVARGTVIGTVGTSGRVDSPRLYFETRSRSTPRNPLLFLERKR